MAISVDEANEEVKQHRCTAWFLFAVCLLSMICGTVFIAMSQLDGFVAAFGLCGVIFVASTTAGSFLGFLFSVPRILSHDNPSNSTADGKKKELDQGTGADDKRRDRRERLLSSNTNLERISEWLTTMLVGVGLSQISFLPQKMRAFSDFLATKATFMIDSHGLPTAGMLPTVAPFIVVSGVIIGFLFLYLYTRLYLSPLFLHVEQTFADRSDLGEVMIGSTGGAEVRSVATGLVGEGAANPSVTFAATTPNLTVNQALSVISSLLYQPDRFEEAITTGNSLMTTPAAKTAQFWFLMTAALGQRYHALLADSGADRSAIVKGKDAVLAAARETVSRDPSYKMRLHALTDPTAQDNDLQDFREDADFLKIVQ